MTPSADNVVLKESSKLEPRTKGRKHQRLWNATFKEIAAFKRVVPSDLGLQRAAARERAKGSTNACLVSNDSIDHLEAARGTAKDSTNAFAFLVPEDSIGQSAAARKRARESLEEHYVPKYGNGQVSAAMNRLREMNHCAPKHVDDQREGAARKRAKYRTEYFVPKDGIDREVIIQDICRYLGDDALVRPGNYEVSIPPTSEIEIMLMLFSEPSDAPKSARILYHSLSQSYNSKPSSSTRQKYADIYSPGNDHRSKSRLRKMGGRAASNRGKEHPYSGLSFFHDTSG
jgi:hypothetical protein